MTAELGHLLRADGTASLARLRERVPVLTGPQRRLLLERLLAPSVEGAVTAELSYAQRGLWFMEKLAPGSGTHNIATGVCATGPLDLQRLQACVNAIIARHEILRTNFVEGPAGPLQIIAPSREIAIAERSFEEVPPSERDEAVMAALVAEAVRPFDLTSGPLLRINSFRTAPDERLLLLTLHHIIGDEWSVGVFLEELGVLFASKGDTSLLPGLTVQYADYAEWQVRTLTPAAVAAEVEYWKRKLAGAPFTLEVSLEKPRPKIRTANGAVEKVLVDRRMFERVRDLARAEQATLFMTLFAAFNVMLHVRTGRRDLLVGTDFANRDRSETARLIGCFVNELVLRTNLSGDPTFIEVIKRVRRTMVDAFNHAELPFQRLVEELRPPRDSSRTPVFQVVFDLLNVPMKLEFDGVTFSPMNMSVRRAKYDLTLFVSESPEQLLLMLEYNTDLYSRATALELLEDYQRVVRLAADHPDVPLSTLVERIDVVKTYQQPAAE